MAARSGRKIKSQLTAAPIAQSPEINSGRRTKHRLSLCPLRYVIKNKIEATVAATGSVNRPKIKAAVAILQN